MALPGLTRFVLLFFSVKNVFPDSVVETVALPPTKPNNSCSTSSGP